MARKKTTRKNHGTLAIRLDPFKSKEDQPEYRGILKIGTDELDVSLWIKAFVQKTPVPLRMTGEVTLKPKK